MKVLLGIMISDLGTPRVPFRTIGYLPGRRLCHQHSSDNTRHHDIMEETSNSVLVTASTMDRLRVSLETLIMTYQRMYNLGKSLFTKTARRIDVRSHGPTASTLHVVPTTPRTEDVGPGK